MLPHVETTRPAAASTELQAGTCDVAYGALPSASRTFSTSALAANGFSM
jgi:hypothetical protein